MKMCKIFIILFLSLLIAACLQQPDTPATVSGITPGITETAFFTETIAPLSTKTQTPESISLNTPAKSLTPTPAPLDEIISPDGKYVAQLLSQYDHPSGKEAIEVRDAKGSVLWVILYQGEMPIVDPRPSLAIYRWAADSSALYFYYSFAFDGWWTLFDGNNLQALDVKTGEVKNIAAGEHIAFAFSPDMSKLAYVGGGEVTIRDVATDLEHTAEIQSKGFLQAGPVYWSPTGDGLVFYVLVDDMGNAQMIYTDIQTMEQRILLEHFIEDYPFDSWTEDGNPRYRLNGSIIGMDVKTNVETVLGTATPKP